MDEGTDNPEFEYALATTPAPEPVPYDEDEETRTQREAILMFVTRILEAADTDREIGRAMLCLGAELRVGPTALEELSRRMGVTKGRVCQILSDLKGDRQDFARFFRDKTTPG